MAYKQQTLIYHSSGIWAVQDQGAGSFSVWWEPTSSQKRRRLLAVSSHGGRSKGALWNFFYKGTNPTCEGSTLKT